MSNWLYRISQHNSGEILKALIPEMVPRVQFVYDQWDQSDEEFGDPELGFGGICQNVAEQISEVVSTGTDFDVTTVSSQVGEQHVWTVVKTPDGVYSIDIPPYLYETGGGYNWQKSMEVQFDPSYFVIDLISADPEDFGEMADY